MKGRSVYSQCHCDVYSSLERSLPNRFNKTGIYWKSVGALTVSGYPKKCRLGKQAGAEEEPWKEDPYPLFLLRSTGMPSPSPASRRASHQPFASWVEAFQCPHSWPPGLGILTRYFCLGKVLSLQPPFLREQREHAMCSN